ncbi:unnamed protein product [Urochloa humidicola]
MTPSAALCPRIALPPAAAAAACSRISLSHLLALTYHLLSCCGSRSPAGRRRPSARCLPTDSVVVELPPWLAASPRGFPKTASRQSIVLQGERGFSILRPARRVKNGSTIGGILQHA